jgi:hypothetical protein
MASFRKRGSDQWQAQVRKKGHPTQTKTFETRAAAEQWARAIEVEMDQGAFVSRAEAESTTLKELLERYLEEVTPQKKGAEPETNRLRLMMRHPLARRFVAGVRGVDVARWRDERLRKVTPATTPWNGDCLGSFALFGVIGQSRENSPPRPVRRNRFVDWPRLAD